MIEHDAVAALADDLATAAGRVYDEAARVVTRGALNIKRGAAQRARGISHAPDYPRAISYDVTRLIDGPEAEIGPDKDRRQGALGNIIEYGAPERRTSPRPHIAPATAEEMPRFEKALSDVSARLLEEGT